MNKFAPDARPPIWRVAEFQSSADPEMRVLMLATGAEEMDSWEKRPDFIKWHSESPDRFKAAYDEWMDKTEWLIADSDTIPIRTLGLHRAEILNNLITHYQKDVNKLRRLLAFRVAGNKLCADDGELQDNDPELPIDFKRDSVNVIEEKLIARSRAAFDKIPKEQIEALFKSAVNSPNVQQRNKLRDFYEAELERVKKEYAATGELPPPPPGRLVRDHYTNALDQEHGRKPGKTPLYVEDLISVLENAATKLSVPETHHFAIRHGTLLAALRALIHHG